MAFLGSIFKPKENTSISQTHINKKPIYKRPIRTKGFPDSKDLIPVKDHGLSSEEVKETKENIEVGKYLLFKSRNGEIEGFIKHYEIRWVKIKGSTQKYFSIKEILENENVSKESYDDLIGVNEALVYLRKYFGLSIPAEIYDIALNANQDGLKIKPQPDVKEETHIDRTSSLNVPEEKLIQETPKIIVTPIIKKIKVSAWEPLDLSELEENINGLVNTLEYPSNYHKDYLIIYKQLNDVTSIMLAYMRSNFSKSETLMNNNKTYWWLFFGSLSTVFLASAVCANKLGMYDESNGWLVLSVMSNDDRSYNMKCMHMYITNLTTLEQEESSVSLSSFSENLSDTNSRAKAIINFITEGNASYT